ncbi:MAG: PLP-dependent aminotransferase family protein, partial [Myxococcales bacterium]|nr:PLP-dependent aminotransferase family protein [Myxococcales bacterium]
RRLNAARRDHLARELSRLLPSEVSFRVPGGGISLWVTLHGVDPDRLVEAAAARRLFLRAGRYFSFEGLASPHLRLGFAHLDESELTQVVEQLAASWPR